MGDEEWLRGFDDEDMKDEGQVWGSRGTRSCPQRPQTTCSGNKIDLEIFLYLCKSKSGI